MSSTYGEHLKLSIFGQSHGAGIGMVLDGIPAGLGVDPAALRAFLARRAPGQNAYSTPRKEAKTSGRRRARRQTRRNFSPGWRRAPPVEPLLQR